MDMVKISSLIEKGLISGDLNKYRLETEMGFNFIRRNSFLKNGNCIYLTDEKGNIKEGDNSMYVDCFVLLGYAAYIEYFNRAEYLDEMMKLYDRTVSRIEYGSYKTEPYSIPAEYLPYGVNMMMLHVTTEVLKTLKKSHDARNENLKEKMKYYITIITETLCDKDCRIVEVLPKVPENAVFARHFTPGHVLESMWFIMNAYKELGIKDKTEKIIKIVKKTYKLGWDEKYDGVFRHVDFEGDKPQGEKTGVSYKKLILNTWDSKLWWPHSEALYTALLLAKKQMIQQWTIIY